MEISYSKRFIKEYKKCSPKIQTAFKERLSILIDNYHHPILNNHKLKGKLEQYRSININADCRAIFQEIDRGIYFVMIGTHSQLYN